MNKDFMRFTEEVGRRIALETGKDVRLQQVKKNNGVVLHGITIMSEGSNVAPTIYLEKWYEEYKEGEDIDDIVAEVIRLGSKEGNVESIDISFFKDYEEVKTKLAYKLINADMNEQLLKEVPHRKFLDLAIVCFCDVAFDGIGDASILIRNEHLKVWGIEAEVLIEDAMKNMQVLFEVEFINMVDVLKELYSNPDNMLDIQIPMWVLTNKRRLYGAGALLYDNQLEQIAEKMQGDFIVLPSSLHEVIITPIFDRDIAYLAEMVQEINESQVLLEERLADSVYIYHRETKSLDKVS